MRIRPIAAILLACAFIVGIPTLITDSFASDVSLNGFLEGNYSYSPDENPDGGYYKWAGERLQLKLDASGELFSLFIKTDASFDRIEDDGQLELREGHAGYTSGGWDLRAGRQVFTWGIGDMIFVNDVFPKDYEAFFSGRTMEYMKKGVDAVRLGAYPDFASFEFIAIPFFEPNNYPDPDRFWMYDPFPGLPREESEPESNLENTELAIRAYRDLAGLDASVYYYRGFFRQPSMMPDNPVAPSKIILFYPELTVYGASIQGRALDGVLSLEAGHYDSRHDRDGDDPATPNSSSKMLLGYQRQLWEDFTLGLQYFDEYMHDYSEYEETLPSGFPKERRLSQLASARLTRFLLHQTLRLSFFALYGLSDGDYMLNPEARYGFTDRVWAAFGANVFGGGDGRSRFGQLDGNDNAYVQLRYEF